MSVTGKIMGITQKNNAQLHEHNGLTPTYHTIFSLVTNLIKDDFSSLEGKFIN